MAKEPILTQDEAYSVACFIDANIYDAIRNDTDIDSMQWLLNITSAYKKLCAYSGYVGLTEDGKGEEIETSCSVF